MNVGVDPVALRAARERLGLTQHQLARSVGVAGGERISRWELGLDEPRPDSTARLARALDVPVIELLNVDSEHCDLRALRYCAGLAVGDVAGAAHISVRSYSRWEAGSWARPPSDHLLRTIARVFAVPLDTVRAALDLSKKGQSMPEA